MTEQQTETAPPSCILLATDLSARCDRALDRAVALAGQWNAALTVVHVLDDAVPDGGGAHSAVPSWRRPPDPASIARAQLVADLGPAAARASVIIAIGDPAEIILRTAEAQGCDLIVTGVARHEPFGRFWLGTTVDQLVGRSTVPLLVVKDRPRHAYRKIVVASDLSDTSRLALEAAVRLFPEQQLMLFHAHEPLVVGFEQPETLLRQQREAAVQDSEAFLKKLDAATSARVTKLLVEQGAPDHLLREYVRARAVDLVVLGTEGRRGVAKLILGSMAQRILDGLPCDALLVRPSRG